MARSRNVNSRLARDHAASRAAKMDPPASITRPPDEATADEVRRERDAYTSWLAAWDVYCDHFRLAAEATRRAYDANEALLEARKVEREARLHWSNAIHAMTWPEGEPKDERLE